LSKLGFVESIYIAPQAKARLGAVTQVRAVPGYGLEGDRYFAKAGTFSPKDVPDRQVTLIEGEAIEALARDYSIELAQGDARRNIVTRGVALNHLVGREFRVGEALLLGTRLCDPCDHLESLTKPGVRAGLIHRGGLRAQILAGGTIAVGDALTTQLTEM
jgi:MOSC domain-containing protein YiiM